MIIPKQNQPDLDEVPDEVLEALEIHLVSKVDEIIPLVLESTETLPVTARAS